jgi:hypothetical protein
VPNLRFASDATSLTWDPPAGAPAGIVYDVARGLVSEFPVGAGAGETCLETGLALTSTSDATPPGLNQGFWYLTRGRSACGSGTYGWAAANGVPTTERVTSSCP